MDLMLNLAFRLRLRKRNSQHTYADRSWSLVDRAEFKQTLLTKLSFTIPSELYSIKLFQ